MGSLRRTIANYVERVAPAEMVDLRVVVEDFDQLSPPPTANSRMRMHEPTDSNRLMELIVYNFVKSDVKLRAGTWREFFDFERKYSGGPGQVADRWTQRAFEILFVASKVDIMEFVANSELSFDEYFSELIRILDLIVASRCGAAAAPLNVTTKGKSFLKSPPILLALKRCVQKALGNNWNSNGECITEDTIRSIIDNELSIFFVDRLAQLRGVIVKDGVVLNLAKLNSFPSNSVKYQANFFTQLVHEAAHFIVRRLVDDFGFTSPIKYDDAGEKLFDPIVAGKGLELGRYVEILIFGFQPNWTNSTRLGALLFLRCSFSSRSALPLFSFLERAIFLRKREKPSVSMAGDYSDSLESFEMIGC